MSKNQNSDINNKNIRTQYQSIETDDYYIEAPGWISPELLDDNEAYCYPCRDYASHGLNSHSEDIDLITNNICSIEEYHDTNLFEDEKYNMNTQLDCVDADLFYIKDSDNKNTSSNSTTNNISSKSKERKKIKFSISKDKIQFLVCIVFAIILTSFFKNLNSDNFFINDFESEVIEQNYTFNSYPEEIFNLSSVASTVYDTDSLDNYLFKKGTKNNEVICIGLEHEDTVLTKLDKHCEPYNKFKINFKDNSELYAIYDIIELPNKDFVIHAASSKNDIVSDKILHYNSTGYLKNVKTFNDDTVISNLVNQPDSENYFMISESPEKTTIHKLTGNGNKVFDYAIEADGIIATSIFPINKDLHVFYSYYNDNSELVSDYLLLNAFGKPTHKKESIIEDTLLSDGFATKYGEYVFEDSYKHNVDVDKPKTIKINSNKDIENTTIEEFDFYTSNIFELEDGFISVRELLFVPNEDETTQFHILTFVKFDKSGNEEWRKYVNYYEDGKNPIINNVFNVKHIYLHDNQVRVEAEGINSLDELENIKFSINSEGTISKIE